MTIHKLPLISKPIKLSLYWPWQHMRKAEM